MFKEMERMDDKIARKIYLVRHAKPDIAPEIYYGGGSDLPLSAEGMLSAKRLATKLGVNPVNICCSTMIRARQTLEQLFPQRQEDMRVVEGLHEIVMGEWELKTFDEMRSSWDEVFNREGVSYADCHCPGGETLRQMQTRAVNAFEKLLSETEGDLLAVLHGGVIWALLCNYFDFQLENVFYYPMHYCSVAELEQSKSGMRLARFNWTPEL